MWQLRGGCSGPKCDSNEEWQQRFQRTHSSHQRQQSRVCWRSWALLWLCRQLCTQGRRAHGIWLHTWRTMTFGVLRRTMTESNQKTTLFSCLFVNHLTRYKSKQTTETNNQNKEPKQTTKTNNQPAKQNKPVALTNFGTHWRLLLLAVYSSFFFFFPCAFSCHALQASSSPPRALSQSNKERNQRKTQKCVFALRLFSSLLRKGVVSVPCIYFALSFVWVTLDCFVLVLLSSPHTQQQQQLLLPTTSSFSKQRNC